MSAGTSDIVIEAGADSRISLTLKSEDGAPINISGWDFRCQVRNPITRSLYAEAVVATRSDLGGAVTLRFPPAETASLPSKELAYDVLAIPPGTDPVRIIEGMATIKARITE